MNSLDDLDRLLVGAVMAHERDPLTDQRWTAWQREVLADYSAYRLIRGANQIGKTIAVCADIIHEIRGTNPFRPRRFAGPINVILISESIEQMSGEGAILEKLWDLLPKDEIDPRVRFVRGEGLRGVKYPAIKFIKGPGAGSVIRLRTYKQDPSTLAGATIHAVYCDEPCPERAYGELVPRVFAHGGTFTISFTPTVNMPDQAWLRKLVEAGTFREHWIRLTEAATWCEGFARPRKTQADIDEFSKRLPGIEVPMRIDAAWEPVMTGRFYTAFGSSCVEPFDLGQLRGAYLVVGIDHGLKAGKQAAVLVAVVDRHDAEPRAWVVDEVQSDGVTTPTQDAQAILDMLRRHGLRREDVDEWIGDRQTGDGQHLRSKTNTDLRKELARLCGIKMEDFPWIHLPRKWNGSLTYGGRLLNGMMAAGHLKIHERCALISLALQKWRGGKMEPEKDILDAMRYAIERAVLVGRPQGSAIRVLT